MKYKAGELFMSIDKCLNVFNKQADNIKSELIKILNDISDGKVPAETIMSDVNNKISNLRCSYDEIYEYAKAHTLESEKIEYGESVSCIVDGVKNSRYRIIQKQLEQAKDILNKFIRVKSEVDKCAQALMPYQDKAKTLLTSICEQKNNTNTEILAEIEAPKCFLKAIDLSKSDQDALFEVMDDIEKYYDHKYIIRGINQGRYYIGTLDNNIELASEKVSKDTEPVDCNISINKTTEDNPNELSATNNVKLGKLNASSLKNDLNDFARISNQIFISVALFTHLGVLSVNQINSFLISMDFIHDTDKEKEKMITALTRMEAKGYLASFSYNNEKIYMLSQGLFECIKKESIRTHIQNRSSKKFNIGNNKLYAAKVVNIELLLRTIKLNQNLLLCYNTFKEYLSKEEFGKLKLSFKIKGNNYEIENPQNNEKIIISEAEEDYKKYIILDNENIKNQVEIIEKTQGEKLETLDSKSESDNNCDIEIKSFSDEKENDISSNTDEIILDSTVSDDNYSEESIYEDIIINCDTKDYEQTSINEIIEGKDVPSEEYFIKLIYNTINNKDLDLNKSISQAITLAYTSSMIEGYERCDNLLAQLELATHIFIDKRFDERKNKYTSNNLSATFGEDKNDPAIMLSAYLLAIMFPDRAYDYTLQDQSKSYFNNFKIYFPDLEAFKALFNDLIEIYSVWDAFPNGLSSRVMAMLGSEDSRNSFIEDLKNRAKDYMDLSSVVRGNVFRQTCSKCLGEDSDIYECMTIILKNDIANKDVVRMVLSDYCIGSNYALNEEKIKLELEKIWNSIIKRPFEFKPQDRTQGIRLYESRINLLKEWIEFVESDSVMEQNLPKLRKIYEKIKQDVAELLDDKTWHDNYNANILKYTLKYMDGYLNYGTSEETFLDFLRTGVFSVGDDLLPIIPKGMTQIRYYEPWRNVLKHINLINNNKMTLSDAQSEIFDEKFIGDSGIKDNFNQLKRINDYTNDYEEYKISDKNIAKAIESADQRKEKFEDKLELAYAYGQINENTKDLLHEIMIKYKASFYETQDFACWRRFLEALEKQINDYALANKQKLIRSLNRRLMDNTDSSMLKEAQDKLNDSKLNLAYVEECINLYDSGQVDVEREYSRPSTEVDFFKEFNNDDIFNPLYKLCQENSGKYLNNFGIRYLEKHWPNGWTNRQKESSKILIENWLSRNTSAENIRQLLAAFGFTVTDVRTRNEKKTQIFSVYIEQELRSKSDYRHPISAFGTQINSPINVICLYGNHTDKQLVDSVTDIDLGGLSIVLIDNAFDLASRRHIGEIFHTQTSGQNPFLLIDKVLLLFLALQQETERIPAMLRCTLPYTSYQPFVRDGGPTADEMFCGRKSELNAILKGASVVYGGRQLGKTALLERAESLSNNPAKKEYAVYVSIVNCRTEQEVVEKIVKSLSKSIIDKKFKSLKKIEHLCAFINDKMSDNSIKKVLLLLDEADDFLESISVDRYLQLQPLVDLKRRSKDAFKFVIAGLHNVCRAKNATEGNGIFGQLGTPLCIRPLTRIDARELLSKPLQYLGFQIEDRHLEMILATTNYYPGILQFFGSMLVETLNNDYARYYRSVDNNPPFTMNDDQLASIINSADLTKSIHSKFELSLELDKRYFMLARCIAICYFTTKNDDNVDNWNGFTVESILDVASTLEISVLKNKGKKSCIVLLDEMVDMGILSKSSGDKYRLRKVSFVDIIGENEDKIINDIADANEEDSNV